MSQSIFFYPSRNLITPTPSLVDLYEMRVILTAFDPTNAARKSTVSLINGGTRTIGYSTVREYGIEFRHNPSETTTQEVDMFLASVAYGEEFFIENLDKQKNLTSLKLVGDWRQQRVHAGSLIFSYQLTARETNALF